MGPLSAVGIVIALVLVGVTWVGWISAGLTFLGAVLLIAAGLVVVDVFLWYRNRTQRRAAGQ